jgi:hypothetical protein
MFREAELGESNQCFRPTLAKLLGKSVAPLWRLADPFIAEPNVKWGVRKAQWSLFSTAL